MHVSVQVCREVCNTVVPVDTPSLCLSAFHFHLRNAEDSVGKGFHQCIECQNLFRADEKKCPNCGKPVAPPLGREKLAVAALLSLVAVLGVVGYQLAASQRSDHKTPSVVSEAGSVAVLPPNEEFELTAEPLDAHYSKLVTLVEEGRFELAAETLSIMKVLKGLDYKDTPLLAKKVVIHGLEEEAERIPARRTADNIAAYQRLLAMDPGNRVYAEKIAHYEAKRREERLRAQSRNETPARKINDQRSAASSAAEPVIKAPF
jgi:hypothetical protein